MADSDPVDPKPADSDPAGSEPAESDPYGVGLPWYTVTVIKFETTETESEQAAEALVPAIDFLAGPIEPEDVPEGDEGHEIFGDGSDITVTKYDPVTYSREFDNPVKTNDTTTLMSYHISEVHEGDEEYWILTVYKLYVEYHHKEAKK